MDGLVERSTAPVSAFDPRYDPLKSSGPGVGRAYAPTYWIATAGPPPPDDGPVAADLDVDVAIIGSGYTGLACAIFLAREFGIKATVLEANQVAWGCSTRNGGQAQAASGRLSRSQWIKRWGVDTARAMHAEILEGFATFHDLTRSIDCDAQPGGHLYVAHRPAMVPKLEAEAGVLREVFGYDARMLSKTELQQHYVDDAEAAGAMHEPDGTGVHAAKLAFGYLRMARALGARVHPASPVQGWETHGSVHHLRTPGGVVRARAVGIATGGYTAPGLHPGLRGRSYPILSNSLVTRPLTADEKAACNFLTTEIITDTRTLRFYYRRLPDDRVQIGSRSAISGADAENPKHHKLLLDGLHRKFPALRGVEVEYSWWGWVDVSHDMMPRVFQPDPAQPVFYALGYGGNGVMYSAQAGRRMAGQPGPALPIFQSPLPGHPLAVVRRPGQRLLYQWYYLRDETP